MKIWRLNKNMRYALNLNKEDAENLHIVFDRQINLPQPFTRYNLRTKDGIIRKYTLGDNFITVTYLKKIGSKYVKYFKNIMKNL